MKKLVKQKWFLFIVALTLVVASLGFLYLIGFRIAYAPGLENSWDAISACAAWVGVGASFVAIWFAIRVPQKIADRQDKIALYDKRMECQKAFRSILNFIEYIEKVDEKGNFTWNIQMKYWAVHDVFQYKFLNKLYGDNSIKILFTTNCLNNDVFAILSSKHLVPGVSKEKSENAAVFLKSYIKCLFQEPSELSQSIQNGTYQKEKMIILSLREFCEDVCEKLDGSLDVKMR